MGADSSTRGEWKATYGNEGFLLANYNGSDKDAVSLPPYVKSYAFKGNGTWVWNKNTPDVRALAPPAGNRVAATARADGSFSLTLLAGDATPHTLALYFLDWDTDVRTQTIALYDAATNELLDQHTLTHFHEGVYYLYEVQGSIRVALTHTGGTNAVLSGVFWDPVNAATESQVRTALGDVTEGTPPHATLTVQRGNQTLLFRVANAKTAAAGETQVAAGASEGLTGHYLAGTGYNQLLADRHDPAIEASWWRDGSTKFPDESTPPTETPLWAEWEGTLVVPGAAAERVIPLSAGQSLGMSMRASEPGILVESVEPGGPAERGGLQVGDVISRVLDQRIRNEREVVFRLDAPGGGYLFVDGVRLLANITCVGMEISECKKTPRESEATRRLEVGERILRVAAVRRGSPEAAAAEHAEEPPIGPLLSWRLPGDTEFAPVPTSALRPRQQPGAWRRTPRQAAQVGLEWLQSTAVAWQQQQGCFGCHVQSQALMGMAIARSNEYRVSDRAYTTLLTGFAAFQNTNGTWPTYHEVTAAQFGAMALAVAGERGREGDNETLMRAVRFLLKSQKEDGQVHLDDRKPPIDEGDILATANARIAFSTMIGLAPPAETPVFEQAESRALRWLAAAKPENNQDRAMKILGLAVRDPERRGGVREQIDETKTDLLLHQVADGGWGEYDRFAANAFATGQALYALRVAGESTTSPAFQRGVQWLLEHQLWTGAWPPNNTQSRDLSDYAPTMWPVIALVGSFGAVEIVAPAAGTCMAPTISLAVRAVTDERVDLVRFSIDGSEVGTVVKDDADGVYRLPWDAGTLPPGPHKVRAEMVRDGETRGADEAVVYKSRTAGQCSGSLTVMAAEGATASALAAPQIEIILDASGSMKRRIGGRSMMDAAKSAVAEVVQRVPNEVQVSLRVYGHRVREKQRGDCEDSELMVRLGKINKADFLRRVRGINALGTTPIAYSLLQAQTDFGNNPGDKMIVLVTDGKEECGGNLTEAATALNQHGFKVRLNIVGFALADAQTKDEMQRVAALTGGRFIDAADAQTLTGAIEQSLAVPYDVVDASGNTIASGRVGERSATSRRACTRSSSMRPARR